MITKVQNELADCIVNCQRLQVDCAILGHEELIADKIVDVSNKLDECVRIMSDLIKTERK